MLKTAAKEIGFVWIGLKVLSSGPVGIILGGASIIGLILFAVPEQYQLHTFGVILLIVGIVCCRVVGKEVRRVEDIIAEGRYDRR